MKAVGLKVIFLSLITFAAFACGKEDQSKEDLLIGKWILTEKTVDNIAGTLSDCEKLSTVEFQVNNFCFLYDGCTSDTLNSGWNYKYGMLNISVHLPAAYYIEQLDNTALKVRRNDISPDGNLQVTVLSYVKIQP